MKFVYCAQCGEKLEVHRKAVQRTQRIYDIIRPHNCGEAILDAMSEETAEKVVENEQKSVSSNLNEMFNSFKFVQKLNKLEPLKSETGDKRENENLRKELPTSSAPPSLFNLVKASPNSSPENDPNMEPEGD